MILLPTLWETVKWKKVLFWYMLISLGMVFGYDPNNAPFEIAILAHIGMTILIIMIVLMVWGKIIYGKGEALPLIWIFSTVVKDIRIFKKTEGSRLLLMKLWCDENCNGKWRYCQHGYFVFRQKTDAMGFKLRWI